MGACASKFTVLKNTSTAPPPAVKYEVEPKEVNLVEEVAVEKDDAPAVEDDASRRQSLGHLLQEGEEKKCSAESDGKASEDVKQGDAVEVKPEAVADADPPVQDEGEKAPVANELKSKCEEEVVQVEADKPEEKPAEPETVKLEITENHQENKAVTVTAKEPEILESEETKASVEEAKKEEEKPAVPVEIETSEKTPETPETERTEEQNPAPGAEKKETDEKSTEIIKIETPEKKPEVTEEPKEAEEKSSEEKSCEISDKIPESPEIEKAADADKIVIEEKPAETENETSEKVEDKHILENETPEACSEELKPVSVAEKPKAEEERATST